METISTISGLLTEAGNVVSGFTTNIGGPVLEFVTSHPLTIVPALAGLCIMGIGVVRRFIYGA